MKTFNPFLIIAILLINIQFLFAQEVIELPFNPIDEGFIELTKILDKIDASDDLKSIELGIEGLKMFKDPRVRYYLMFWELSFHYANLKQYDKCLEILQKGQKEDLAYIMWEKENTFPEYILELEKLAEFKKFSDKNTLLNEASAKLAKTEFMIQLPENYDKNKMYPLIIIMHGGVGSIFDMQLSYDSPKLKKDFIVAYFQGSNLAGSNTRIFSDDWLSKIQNGYEQIVSKYPVDTNKIILAGPSAGGARSIILGLNNLIPAKGLLLSFSVAPSNIDSTAYINSAKRGLKIALFCGENDWAIKQQKELGFNFDKYGITNRFVVFPEKGHEFPDNWSYYLDTSLEFILKEE